MDFVPSKIGTKSILFVKHLHFDFLLSSSFLYLKIKIHELLTQVEYF